MHREVQTRDGILLDLLNSLHNPEVTAARAYIALLDEHARNNCRGRVDASETKAESGEVPVDVLWGANHDRAGDNRAEGDLARLPGVVPVFSKLPVP